MNTPRMRPSPVYNLIAGLTWPLLHGLFRLRSAGRENLPAEGGFVLACNHVSSFDPWPLGVPLWPRTWLRFMAKSELYWFPLSKVVDWAGAFPVKRGQRDVVAIDGHRLGAGALDRDRHLRCVHRLGKRLVDALTWAVHGHAL